MFEGAISFNQDINSWDVSNVNDLRFLFKDVKSFNKPLDKWDVGRVQATNYLFDGATSFNQDISSWNLNERYVYGPYEFRNCPIKEEYKPKVLRKK